MTLEAIQFSQGEMITFTLEETKGELKSDEPTVYHGFTNADSDINATCVYEIHGHWAGPSSSLASLFVIRFDLSSHAGRKFCTFEPMIEFKQLQAKTSVFQKTKRLLGLAGTPAKSTKPPAVAESMFEPGARGAMTVCEVHGDTEREWVYQASLGVSGSPLAPVNASIGTTQRKVQKFPQNYRYEVRAGFREERRTIYWNALQDKELGMGIDKVQVAFVALRPDADDFSFDLTLSASADAIYNTMDALLPWRAKKAVVIRPRLSNVDDCPPGVDREQLCLLKENKNAGLVRLTHIHIPEKWNDPMAVYLGTSGTS
jgi:hypothetical protein